jgi:DNA-binding Lrp family transcriptional regulator
LKNIELRLIGELMKECRRSDRELAKILGVSQPTISRMIKKLEKEGYISGYSAIPNFEKLGFEILAITFAKLKKPITPTKLEKGRKEAYKWINSESSPAIIGMSGIGCDADRVLITFHEDYSKYFDFYNFLKSQSMVEVDGVKSFLINLKDKNQFLPPSLKYLAGHILERTK